MNQINKSRKSCRELTSFLRRLNELERERSIAGAIVKEEARVKEVEAHSSNKKTNNTINKGVTDMKSVEVFSAEELLYGCEPKRPERPATVVESVELNLDTMEEVVTVEEVVEEVAKVIDLSERIAKRNAVMAPQDEAETEADDELIDTTEYVALEEDNEPEPNLRQLSYWDFYTLKKVCEQYNMFYNEDMFTKQALMDLSMREEAINFITDLLEDVDKDNDMLDKYDMYDDYDKEQRSTVAKILNVLKCEETAPITSIPEEDTYYPVSGYEGLYEVNRNGVVRSIKRKTPVVLKQKDTAKGKQVVLVSNNKSKRHHVTDLINMSIPSNKRIRLIA